MKRKRKIASVLIGMFASVGIISSISIPETSSIYKKERKVGYLSYASTIAADNGVTIGIDLMSSSTPKEARFKLSLKRFDNNASTKYLIYVPKACMASNLTSGVRVGTGDDSNKIEFVDGIVDVQTLQLNCEVKDGEKEIKISLNNANDNSIIYGSYTLDLDSYIKRLQYNNFKNIFSEYLIDNGIYSNDKKIDFNDESDIYVKYLNHVKISPSTIVSKDSWLGITKIEDVDGSKNGYYNYEFSNLKGYVNTLEYSKNNNETRIYFTNNSDITRNMVIESLRMYNFSETDINYIISYIDKNVTNYSELFTKEISGIKFDNSSLFIDLDANILDIAQGSLDNYFKTFEINLSGTSDEKIDTLNKKLNELLVENLVSDSLIKLLTSDGSAINADIITDVENAKSYYVLEDKFDYLIDISHEKSNIDGTLKTVVKITLLDKSFENLKNEVITYFDNLGSSTFTDSYDFMLYVNDVENGSRLKEYIRSLFEADEKYIYNVDFTENTDEKYGFYPIDVVITVKNSNIVGDDLGGEITNPEVPILPGENDGEDNTESEKPPVIDDNTSTGTGDETEGEEDLPLCSDTITDNCKPKEDTPNPDEGGEKEPDACVGEDCKTDADTGDTETGSGENTEDGGDVPVEDAGSETTPDSQDGGDTQLDQGEVSDAQPVLEEVPSSDKLI